MKRIHRRRKRRMGAMRTKEKVLTNKTKSERILNGPMLGSMLLFTLPLILTSILQQMYSTADTLIVGMAGGKESLSAVGASGSIIALCVTLFVNIFVGTNILVARYTGERNEDVLERIVSTTYIMSLVMGVILMVVGELFAKRLLILTECPVEILDEATKYLRIYFFAAPASMITNFSASVIRNSGDSRSPFIYLSVSGAANVLFNLIFVFLLGDPVAAVAWATVISIYLGAVLFLMHMMRMNGAMRLSPFRFRFDKEIFGKTLRLGIPTALANCCFVIPNILIQPVVNSFGTDGISGMSAASAIEDYVNLITSTFGTTTAVFIGQNMGAGNKPRVKSILIKSYILTVSIAIVLSCVLLTVAKPLLGLFIPGEEAAIEFGYKKLSLCLSASFLASIIYSSSGSIQAHGKTMLPMISNIVGACLFRIIWILFVYPLNPVPENFFICYPLSWAICAVFLFTASTILTRRYLKSNESDSIVAVKK